MKKLKISILCAGNMARQMADTLVQMEEVELYAVAARDLSRAEAFAEKYQFQKAYGSYEELAADEGSDLIYIASPHSHHYQHTKLCLNHGRNVLCEKPFTVNAAQAEELFAIAEGKRLFLMEAFWTRLLPYVDKLRELLDSEVLGKVKSLTADFGGYGVGSERMTQPELAGGALLDVGVYCLSFADMIFGADIQEIQTCGVKTDLGVDAQSSTILRYRDGKIATLCCSMVSQLKNQAVVYCEHGRVELDEFWHSRELKVYLQGQAEAEIIPVPYEISGYEYQIRAAKQSLEAGKTQFEGISHEYTLRIMKQMDQLRQRWGVQYPFE